VRGSLVASATLTVLTLFGAAAVRSDNLSAAARRRATVAWALSDHRTAIDQAYYAGGYALDSALCDEQMVAVAKDAERRGDFETARYGYDSVLQLEQARAGGVLEWTTALGGSGDVSENARKTAKTSLKDLRLPKEGAAPSAHRFTPSHVRALGGLAIALLLGALYLWAGQKARPSKSAPAT
jgi:hypothetical protein